MEKEDDIEEEKKRREKIIEQDKTQEQTTRYNTTQHYTTLLLDIFGKFEWGSMSEHELNNRMNSLVVDLSNYHYSYLVEVGQGLAPEDERTEQIRIVIEELEVLRALLLKKSMYPMVNQNGKPNRQG